MARKDANPGQHEAAAARRLRSFDLRVAGATYREIGHTLDISEAQAHRDVKATLGTLAELERETAEEYRTIELARLDAAVLALYPLLESGDPAVINSWVRISESRRKLLGLDAPTAVNVGGALTAPAYMALRAAVLQMLPGEQRLLLAEALDQVIDVTNSADSRSSDGTRPGANDDRGGLEA